MAKRNVGGVVPGDSTESKKKSKDSVVVTWNGGSREYSLEVHGEDFKDLAQEFADKHNGTVE